LRSMRCIYKNCSKQPHFNLPNIKKALYCFDHKDIDMIDVTNRRCIQENCGKIPSFNVPSETSKLYCAYHKKLGMVNLNLKKCGHNKCKNNPIYGFVGKRKQFCEEHKQENMVNLDIEYKCISCEKEYDFLIDNKKYCLEHCPNKDYEIKLKKKCKFCDIEEKSNFVCGDCKKIMNKKEWAIVRYIKKNINMTFKHNTSEPVNECSNRRPDVFFELPKHCVIVEIDENQHKSYQEICECARINEIVNSIGGKSVIFVRYNPDKTYNKKKEVKIEQLEKLSVLIKTIKEELSKDHDKFCVKIIQLYYDDNYAKYKNIKKEDITDLVAV
jgi:hypothetical protein